MKSANQHKLQEISPIKWGILLWSVFLSITLVSCNGKKPDEPVDDIEDVATSLKQAQQATKAAKEGLAEITERREAAREAVTQAEQNLETTKTETPTTEQPTTGQTTTPNPDKAEAQKNHQEALANFQQIEKEWQAQQRKVTEAETEEERLQKKLEQMQAEAAEAAKAKAQAQAEYDALSPEEQRQLNSERTQQSREERHNRVYYSTLTSVKEEAEYYLYKDKYMNPVSLQEAIFLTTHRCSERHISPEQEHMQRTSAICEDYINWMGVPKGYECFCQFLNTLNDGIFYIKSRNAWSNARHVSTWYDDYQRLTSSQ